MDAFNKLTQFAETSGIRSTITYAKANPAMSHWAGASHFKVTLRRTEERVGSKHVRQLTVPFSQGGAHRTPPSVGMILNAVVNDVLAWGHDAEDFNEFCWNNNIVQCSGEALAAARKQYRLYRSLVQRAEVFFGPNLLGSMIEIMNDDEDTETWDAADAIAEAV